MLLQTEVHSVSVSPMHESAVKISKMDAPPPKFTKNLAMTAVPACQ